VTGPDETVLSRVEGVLVRFLDERVLALRGLGSDLDPVADEARAFVLDGGKRLRPRFAYWGWRAAAPHSADDTALIGTAASLELLHAGALVHDDVVDASATRRGRPASHTTFARQHREAGWGGVDASFGAAAAILLGDLLLSWSDALFAAAHAGAAARAVYDRMREQVMAGQYLDVLVSARGAFSVDEALRVIELKTSKYTVEGPLHLGAAVAGARPETLVALRRYGLAVGEAFQLRDDVLGVFGDPSVTGKPAGDDLREGKHTLLTAYAMQTAGPEQAEQLRRDLGDRDLDADQLAQLRRVVVGTGALDRVEARIADQAQAARQALDTDAVAPAARVALAALVDAATRRAH